MSNKNIDCYIKLRINATQANSSPVVAPVLGQRGLNIKQFCDEFNNQTKHIQKEIPLSVLITVYDNRTFSFNIKTPPASFFFKKTLNFTKGSSNPNTTKIGIISLKHIYEIAKIKKIDNNFSHLTLESIVKMLVGSAKSMGLRISK